MKIINKKPDKSGAGRKQIYPFQNIKPGQCLEIPSKSVEDHKRVHSAAYSFRKRNNLMHWKFSVHSDGDFVRVYRLS